MGSRTPLDKKMNEKEPAGGFSSSLEHGDREHQQELGLPLGASISYMCGTFPSPAGRCGCIHHPGAALRLNPHFPGTGLRPPVPWGRPRDGKTPRSLSISPEPSPSYLSAPAGQLQHLQLVQVLPPAREGSQALPALLQSLEGILKHK